MLNLKRTIRLASLVLLALALAGCQSSSKSSSSSSSPSSSSSSSSSSAGGSSSSQSGSSSSMPAGGGYNPSPSSGQAGLPGKSGGKPGDIGNKGDAGATQKSSSKSGGQSGEGSEDQTLSDALEEFERARNKGGASSQASGDTEGAQAAVLEEADFPLIMPPSAKAGDELEQQAAAEGGMEGGLEGGGQAQTDAEKVAVLDRQLEDSYGQFEGRILRERGYVRDKENARGSDVDIDAEGVIVGEQSAGGAEGSGSGQGATEDAAGGPITGSGDGNRPEGGDQREGDYQHAATTHKPPADIPDGSDDDVVARQLREAAMHESDPELREKLWDEYRKYKNKSKTK